MKTINLTQGKIALVDNDDFEKIKGNGWYVTRYGYAGKGFYKKKKETFELMHRLIMNLKKGDKKQIDHINHNKLDNRKCNLRVCTISENKRNTLVQKNNNSGFKGVYWHKKRCKWIAQIQFNKKTIHLGDFDDKINAAKTYNESAKIYFGEFACLNSII